MIYLTKAQDFSGENSENSKGGKGEGSENSKGGKGEGSENSKGGKGSEGSGEKLKAEKLKLEISQAWDQLLQREDVGFLNIQKKDSLWEESQKWGETFRQKFSHLVIVGIGGSSLGARVIGEVFKFHSEHKTETEHKTENKKNLHFLDNTDPQSLENFFLKDFEWNKIGWVIVSKSGSTLETLSLTSFVSQHLAQKNICLTNQALVICEKRKNPLFDWATQHQIPCLDIPESVGGRFSVLTSVGMFPAAFIGCKIEPFRQSISEVLKNHRSLVEDLVFHSIRSFSRGESITMFWFYSGYMFSFGRWLEQLWAESLGKKNPSTHAPIASTPVACIGSTDQHSLLQQVMEGPKDKFVWFIRFKEIENRGAKLQKSLFSEQNFLQNKTMGQIFSAQAIATQQAMEQAKVPCLELTVDRLDEFHLGQMFVLFEMVVALIGEYHQINAFDQPGVEKGKKLTLGILKN